MQIAPCTLNFNQVRNDLVQQTFPLMGAADGKAPQGVAKAASGANDLVVFVEHGADVVEISVALEALLFQKCIHLCKRIPVGRVNLRNAVFRHEDVPPF